MLLRAGEVVAGEDVAAARRAGRGAARLGARAGPARHDARPAPVSRPASTPATPAGDGAPARARARVGRPRRMRTGPRVGVAGAGGDAAAYPWRFWLDGEPTRLGVPPGTKPRVRHGRPA